MKQYVWNSGISWQHLKPTSRLGTSGEAVRHFVCQGRQGYSTQQASCWHFVCRKPTKFLNPTFVKQKSFGRNGLRGIQEKINQTLVPRQLGSQEVLIITCIFRLLARHLSQKLQNHSWLILTSWIHYQSQSPRNNLKLPKTLVPRQLRSWHLFPSNPPRHFRPRQAFAVPLLNFAPRTLPQNPKMAVLHFWFISA